MGRAFSWFLPALALGCAAGDDVAQDGGDGGAGTTGSGATQTTGAGPATGSSSSATSTTATTGATATTTTGGSCTNPATDCPPTGTPCVVAVCSQSMCATTNAPVGTPCSENGGTQCNGAGSCVGTCTDSTQNGSETGPDCGGSCPNDCADGLGCNQGNDCQSATCVSNVCVACGTAAEPCCPNAACDSLPYTCVTNTSTPWGGTSQECNCGILREGQELGVDDGRWSCDGRFFLVMQSDGNLVLYYNGFGALWSSNTYGTGSNHAVMQGDGNFVVYDAASQAWWASGSNGATNAYLAIQNDGNLVVYDGGGGVWWASNTCCY